jgi:hypothetical protein
MGHKDVSWRLGASPSLEERLQRSLEARDRGDGSDDIRWVCPRCHHEHLANVFRDQVWAGLAQGGRNGEIDLRCECGYPHPGRPENEAGCGFRAVVLVAEEEE